MTMDVLFCGLGSIGKRHLKNLKALVPDAKCYALRSARDGDAAFDKEWEVQRVKGMREIPALDIAFICNPSSMHADTAQRILERFSCPLFIEKPIDSNLEKAERLVGLLEQKRIPCMVGYMMRYNRALRAMKEAMPSLGKIHYYDSVFQTYLPDWHPWEDYRTSYASRKEMGGGVLLTMIHEIDIAYWLFGEVKQVTAESGRISGLEMDVEDYADMLFTHGSGVRGRIHLDYFTKKPARTIRVVGENGVLEWDFFTDSVRRSGGKEWKEIHKGKDPDFVNTMYVELLKDFLESIQQKKKMPVDERDGLYTLRLAMTAKKSAESGKGVGLK